MSLIEYKKTIVSTVIGLAVAATIFDGYFITQEGTRDVVKRTGQIVRQVAPGLHFKIPIIESVITVDVKIFFIFDCA